MQGRKLCSLFVSILLFVFGIAAEARAALGESADSVLSDQKSLSAVHAGTQTRNAFTIQEISSEATTIREYISPSGMVFGIAWNGLTEPDLTLLLGSYAEEYLKLLKETPRKRGHRFSHLKTDNLVVEKWGHMRRLQGRAYVPALIPKGVTIDDIR